MVGRVLLPILFRLELHGRENFPRKGPLLVVGNHTAAMEAVLLNIYSPWQIEMLSAADMPAEKITETISEVYGVIPLRRGSYDRAALTKALDVLKQDGIIGLFPEGGIWEEGKKKALPGIAWLSYHSGAPVLPIGFSDTTGTLNAGLKFKRPRLKMSVGQALPAVEISPGEPRKKSLQDYATLVMEAVHQLVPAEDYLTEPEIINEWFEMEIIFKDNHGQIINMPSDLKFTQALTLAKFLHRPAILKIFKVNLELPVDPLQNLGDQPSVSKLIPAVKAILHYLMLENPYLLTYRFGIKEGLAMQKGLEELLNALEWCLQNNHTITITPVRHFYSIKKNQEVIQEEQRHFQSWM